MSYLRLGFMGLALLACFAVGRGQVVKLLADPTVWPPDDYVEYWAAGRLNLHGQNPYSPELLLPLERHAGRDTDEAIMMWNPPWTLAVVMPLGAIPAREGQLLWLLVSFLAMGLSAWLIWETYCGAPSRTPVAFGIALTFLPTLFLLQSGQIGAFVLLGAALFVWFLKQNRQYSAGAAACLIAIKPHLAYLLWLAIFVDAVAHRRWRIIVGGGLCGLAMSGIATAFNPHVWDHYLAAYRDHPPAQWVSLTLGVLLRLMLGQEKFWLQFVPMALGLAWFTRTWLQHGRSWNWSQQMPGIVLVSFVTAPYGAWHFDLVLLLLPILQLAAAHSHQPLERRGWLALGCLVFANLVMLGMVLAKVWTYWYGWVAPLTLLVYSTARPRAGVESSVTEEAESTPPMKAVLA
jgi:hypothetical protein